MTPIGYHSPKKHLLSSTHTHSRSDNHTTLTQQVATTGMLGWIQGFLRHRLFGLIPPLGLRGGLIVAGVAAISSLVMYNLSGYGHGGSAGGGAAALAGDGPSLSAGSER